MSDTMSATASTAVSAGADNDIAFDHQQSAHCESGAISALLRHRGLSISEPMAFGAGAGLSYAYLPFIKISGLPLFSYRMPPGHIIRGLTRRLGIGMHERKFKDPDAGMRALDDLLAQGRVVGLQTSAYWLTYFPPDMRFHFNAHNLVVYGKRGRRYLISDPVMDIPAECDEADLKKARFTRGVLAPHGRLYYPTHIPTEPDMARAVRKAIRFTTNVMLRAPLPLFGVRGVRMVARKIARLQADDARHNKLLLGHIVRMQEEIGTGGAGFRFLYASFLQEAADLLDKPDLIDIAGQLTDIGDEWRRFALHSAKMCKDRMPMDYALLADQLRGCADGETDVYLRLRTQLQ